MSVLNYQKAFAKVLTNPDMRDELKRGKINKLSELELDERQKADLLAINNRLLESYSKMLVAGRLSCIFDALPLTSKIIPENFLEDIFSEYEKQNQSSSKGSPTVEEVKRFYNFIEENTVKINKFHPYLSDVGRYEATCFLFKNDIDNWISENEENTIFVENEEFLTSKLILNKKVKTLTFECDIVRIINELSGGDEPEIQEKNSIVVFQSIFGKVKTRSISPAVFMLLNFFDGKLSVREVIEDFFTKYAKRLDNKEVIQASVLMSIKNLAQTGVLRIL